MKQLQDYMLLFRLEPNFSYSPTNVEIAFQKQQWGNWIGGIAAQAKLVSTTQLGFNGEQLSADLSVNDGVNIAENKMVGGNMVVKATSIDEAVELAKGCPILNIGGTVEVRDTILM